MLVGYPRPSLAGIGVPWVLTGTHLCALMPRVASRQSANPFVVGVVLKSCVLERSRRDVLRCKCCQILELTILTKMRKKKKKKRKRRKRKKKKEKEHDKKNTG